VRWTLLGSVGVTSQDNIIYSFGCAAPLELWMVCGHILIYQCKCSSISHCSSHSQLPALKSTASFPVSPASSVPLSGATLMTSLPVDKSASALPQQVVGIWCQLPALTRGVSRVARHWVQCQFGDLHPGSWPQVSGSFYSTYLISQCILLPLIGWSSTEQYTENNR